MKRSILGSVCPTISGHKMIVALVLTGTVATYAAATPNGRPFVEIAGQIVEVQGAIDSLETQHADLQARVQALEDAGFQAQIDFLTSEIADLVAENGLRIAEIQDIIAAAGLTDLDVEFALSELIRLEGELEDADAAQIALIADLQSQINVLRTDIATNASGLLGVVADAQGNSALIGLLEIDIARIDADVASLEAELAGKQNDIVAACSANQFVIDVLDDGTLICGEDQVSAGATLTVATVFGPIGNLDNTQVEFSFNHCFILLGLVDVGHPPCGFLEVSLPVPHFNFFSGDKTLSATCPAGFKLTGGGFQTNAQNDIVIEDSSTSFSGSNTWVVTFDNRDLFFFPKGILGRATANCVRIN